MCLIFVKEKEQLISNDFLENVFTKNPHGWGIVAYKPEGGIEVLRGMDLVGVQKAVNDRMGWKLAVHFRMATQGARDLTMTHPFKITDDIWFMHNGVMSNHPKSDNKDWSDTMCVAELIIAPIIRNAKNPSKMIRSKWFHDMIGAVGGSNNKLLFADAGGIVIVNNATWYKTKDNVVVSNTYAYSIDHANGKKPEPKPVTTYNSAYYSDLYAKNSGQVAKQTATIDYTKPTMYSLAMKDVKSLPMETFEDLHAWFEEYPDLLNSVKANLILHQTLPKERSELFLDLYMRVLYNEFPSIYSEYLQPSPKGDYYLMADKKVYKVVNEESVESCCLPPESETTADKGESNDATKVEAA